MSHSVVINNCYGGFGLSDKAVKRLKELGYSSPDGDLAKGYGDRGIPRHHPLLVQVVKELGEEASSRHADLIIVQVEGLYRVEEYDGTERVVKYGEDDWFAPAFY